MMPHRHHVDDAPARNHIATFERTPEALADAAVAFLEGGLRGKGGVIMVAGPVTSARFFERMRAANRDIDALQQSGRLVFIDAESALARIVQDGVPNWDAFVRIAEDALRRVKRSGRRGPLVYGELVNLLWSQGSTDAAIRLEEFWNRLARSHRFVLFCGYVLDARNRDCYATPLHAIGHAHTDVVESHEDDRFDDALDSACVEIYGVGVERVLNLMSPARLPGVDRLPTSWSALHWLMHEMPASGNAVLARTLRLYRDSDR